MCQNHLSHLLCIISTTEPGTLSLVIGFCGFPRFNRHRFYPFHSPLSIYSTSDLFLSHLYTTKSDPCILSTAVVIRTIRFRSFDKLTCELVCSGLIRPYKCKFCVSLVFCSIMLSPERFGWTIGEREMVGTEGEFVIFLYCGWQDLIPTIVSYRIRLYRTACTGKVF